MLPFDGYRTSPSPFLSSLHLSVLSLVPRPGCATHRHHLAIHLGPVLLITRLELRTRTGTAGVRETFRAFEKKGGEGGHARARPPASPARAIVVLISPSEVWALSFFFALSSCLPFSPARLPSSPARKTAFLSFATKGSLYAAAERVYFIRRMLFSAPRGYSRHVSCLLPARGLLAARSRSDRFVLSFLVV